MESTAVQLFNAQRFRTPTINVCFCRESVEDVPENLDEWRRHLGQNAENTILYNAARKSSKHRPSHSTVATLIFPADAWFATKPASTLDRQSNQVHR